jgi:TolA-binding protein
MTDHDTELPEPLRVAGATKLEQRLLDAASRERPSRGATERMARSLGVAPPALGGEATTASGGESLVPPAAVATGGMSWLSSAIIAIAVGGVAVGGALFALRSGTDPAAVPAVQPRVEAPRGAPTVTAATEEGPAAITRDQPQASPAATVAQPRPSASAGDLGEQIALLDAARSAMAAGSGERALDLLQRYLAKYPSGSFRPEATALKIETLLELGRKTEARALAERFIATQRGSPLSNRVQRLTEPSPR